jgi:hypothetical protein
MGTTLINRDGKFSLASIDNEQDLLRRAGVVNLNRPPKDGRCECCGRHISELKPFGKARHPIFGDVEGALLIKRWRKLLAYDPRPNIVHGEMFVRWPAGTILENGMKYLIEKSGDGRAEEIRLYHFSGESKVGASWECRDCAFLNEDEYFEKLRRRKWEEASTWARN